MSALFPLLIYVAIFVGAFFVVRFISTRSARQDYTSLKTVTFGDESTVSANRAASVISVLTLFVLWGMFTGSSLLPGFLHAPGPFEGDTSFTYTAQADGQEIDATVHVRVHPVDQTPEKIAADEGPDDSILVGVRRTLVFAWDKNDGVTRKENDARITAVNGQAIALEERVEVPNGSVLLTRKGSLSFTPAKGWQMEGIWLPSPEMVWDRFLRLISEGYQNFTLAEHLGWSLFRVVVGFLFGALVGIPLGYAMGLSDWARRTGSRQPPGTATSPDARPA